MESVQMWRIWKPDTQTNEANGWTKALDKYFYGNIRKCERKGILNKWD